MTEPATIKPPRRHWRWLVPGLLVLPIVVFLLLVGTNPGSRLGLNLVRSYLPESVALGDVQGRLLGPLTIERVRVSTKALVVEAEQIDLDWSIVRWLWSDTVTVHMLGVRRLTIRTLPSPASAEPGYRLGDPIPAPEAFSLPLTLELADVSIDEIALIDGDLTEDLGTLRLVATWAGDRIELSRLALDGGPAEVNASGLLQTNRSLPVEIEAELRLLSEGAEPVEASASLSGQWNALELTVALKSPASAELSAALNQLASAPALNARLRASVANGSGARGDLPGLTANADVRVTGPLDALAWTLDGELESLADTPVPAFVASGSGRLTTEVLSIDQLSVDASGQPEAVVVNGELSWVDGLAANLTAHWQALALPVGEDNVAVGAGELMLSGSLESWTLRLNTRSFNPEPLWPAASGALDVEVSLGGQWTESTQVVDVTSASISGRLRQRPLTLSLIGRYDAGEVDLSELRANYAGNTLAAAGVWGESLDVTYAVDAMDLSALAALLDGDASGELTAHGQVSGVPGALNVETSLEASGIRLADTLELPEFGLESLSLLLRVGERDDAPLSLALDASELTIEELTLARLNARVAGTRASHDVTISADDAAVSRRLALAVSASLQGEHWRFADGDVSLVITTDDEQRGQALTSSMPFAGMLSPDEVRLEGFCLTGNDADGTLLERFCLNANLAGDTSLISAQLEGLQPGRLQPWVPETVRLNGEISGQASWRGSLADLDVDLRWNAPSFSIFDQNRWSDPVVFDDASLRVAPQDDQLRVELRMPGQQQRLVATGTLAPEVGQNFANWPVAGKAELRLPDIDFVAALSPMVSAVRGEARVDAELTGSIGRPELSLNGLVSAPEIQLSEPVLTLRDTRLKFSASDGPIAFTGRSRSGDGEVELSGTVDPVRRLLTATLSGNNFRVSDSAEVRIDVSPDLVVDVSDGAVAVRGEVAIPRADIVLQQLPEGAVTVSPDQVIVSEAGEPTGTLAVTADLDIQLGEQVTFSGLGLDARFGGGLKIRERPGRATSAVGEVDVVSGSYQAYGQDLTIERGRLIYAGGPVDDPGLNVRAVRQATPEVKVGVDVRGSLANPTLSVFSQPPLPSSDQIAYLVLGRPLSGSTSSEQSALRQAALALGVRGGKLVTDRLGEQLAVDTIDIESAAGAGNDQAALVIGKYLTPKLYVSYGYGLFEPISTLRLEYQINRLWRLVTESSNEATGGDIEWVMEK